MIRDTVKPEKRQFARTLRRKPTQAETCLWHRLRQRQLGVPFRRQVIIRGYIVDFYCATVHLIVEVDGSSHLGREAYDGRRDGALARLGLETIRFTNEDALADCDRVIGEISAAVQRRLKLPIKRFIPEHIKQALWEKHMRNKGQMEAPVERANGMHNVDWKENVNWRSLATDHPGSKRDILCAFRMGDSWKLHVCPYYPESHCIYVYQTKWTDYDIKRKDVHWTELPLPPGETAEHGLADSL